MEQPDPSVLFNSAANLAGLIVGNSFGFISGLLTARILGPEGTGILAVAFGVSEFGRGLSNFTHNPSIVAYHRGHDAARVFGTSLALKLIGTGMFVGLVAALALPLGSFFDVPWWTIILTSLVLVAGIFHEIGAARFEAENKMVVRNVLVALGPSVGLAAVLAFVLAGRYDVGTSIVTSIIGTTAMSLGFVAYWRSPWRLRWDPHLARYLMASGSRIALATLLNSSLIWTDTLLISHFLGHEPTGIYQAAFSLTFVMVTASVAVGVALVPVLSRLAGKGESTAQAYQRGTLLALTLATLIALAYALFGRWILGFYGPGFEAGYPALMILTLFGIFGALAVPATSVLTVHDKPGKLIQVGLAQLAANVVLQVLLIPRFGITGAAVATTSVFCLGTLVLWWMVQRDLGAWPLSRAVIREGASAVGGLFRRRRFQG